MSERMTFTDSGIPFRSRLEREIAEERRERTQRLAAILAYPRRGSTRYDARCAGCSTGVMAGTGSLYKVPVVGGGERWFVVCDPCRGIQ